MKSYLLGYKKFNSKDGKEMCVANICTEYSSDDIERGCVGSSCEEIFVPASYISDLTPACISKEIIVSYQKVGTMFRLSNFKILKE